MEGSRLAEDSTSGYGFLSPRVQEWINPLLEDYHLGVLWRESPGHGMFHIALQGRCLTFQATPWLLDAESRIISCADER